MLHDSIRGSLPTDIQEKQQEMSDEHVVKAIQATNYEHWLMLLTAYLFHTAFKVVLDIF